MTVPGAPGQSRKRSQPWDGEKSDKKDFNKSKNRVP